MGANKNFFNELREEEEYLNCFMRINTWNDIPKNLKEQIYFNEIQQKETKELNLDETFCELVKKYNKAKKELRDYKFNYFNK